VEDNTDNPGAAQADNVPETGTADIVPQETDNGPKPGDGDIQDQARVSVPPSTGRRRVTGVTPAQVLAAAARHVGIIEDPVGSNRQPFGAAYGMNGVAWCNIFVSQIGHEVTADYALLGKYAYTPACATWWNGQRRFGRHPRSGAVVFFDWSGSKSIQAIDHVGLVVESRPGGLVRTIEGNSAVPGRTDGVWYHDRNPAYIVGYGYPAYGGTVPGPHIPEDIFGTYRAVAAGSRQLAVLDAGDDVKALQRLLNIGVDGKFGAITKNAVMAYQRAHHLTVDGVVGPATWGLLLGSHGHEQQIPRFPGPLRRGSAGGAVRTLQQRLKDRGWSLGVDGSYGPSTESVVRAFQKDKGLHVDGVVGPRTWAALWTAPVT
jgi:peptidoglycan hydrolase-like protein with peptidoglycan-binding domain